ncbi:acyl-CoA thioesterase [Francisellaceae bacterium]|nr:acyl-CoA thioesterase [Francisellaceae bacterium]
MPHVFEHSFPVKHEDIYFNGHVANDVYVRWMYESALQHSIYVGIDLDTYVEMNTMIVVRRNEVDYYYPAYEGDEIIVKTWVDELRRSSATRFFEIMLKNDRKLLVKAKSIYVSLNLTTHRPISMPQKLINEFGLA